MTAPDRAVVVFTADLMDASRIRAAAAAAGVEVDVRRPGRAHAFEPGDLVLADLRVGVDVVERVVAAGAEVIAYGSHVDTDVLARVSALGAEALARSVFFRRLADGSLLSPRDPDAANRRR